ncbi:MAG: C4-type zinc ribbon domain-containing protein [Bacteroidaceae bacterium]|nr:C4-type zinc ribbon domain-containing protein [Bacteroidaceae bacterium]
MATKETKKDPSEYTVEEKLKALYQLQTMLSEIDKIKTLRGELPLEVKDLEDEIAGLTTRIENNRNDIAQLTKGISEHKNNIQTCRAQIEKYTESQNNVSNNREYDSLNKEIEYQNLEIELSEKKIREFSQELSNKNDELARNTALIEDKQQDLELKKAELDEIIEETRQEEEKLREKSKALELTIDPRLLLSFKRIRKNVRNGLGIVYVQRDACGGCFNKIPAQRQLDIRMRKKIIVCEYCGRIIIDPELAGIQEVKAAEPATKKRVSRKKAAESSEAAE